MITSIIRKNHPDYRIIGCDIDNKAIGFIMKGLLDEYYICPRCTELLEKYCELYVGRPSGIPLLRIKPKGAKKICPFLFRSKCKIHEVKPTVCALFPVGRATAFDKESGKPEVMYFVQQTNCGAKDVSNNLQEWIRGCISEYDEKCGMLWNQMLRAVLAFISGIKGEISGDTYSCLVQIMYCGYENAEDFAEEITSRIDQIKELEKKMNGKH